MNDAYTIGLTLALDDGVSAGIATIRRELSTLDQAILVSTANLVRLQELARGAVSAGVAQAGAMAALTRDSAAAAVRQAAVPMRPPEAGSEATAAPPAAPADDQGVSVAVTPTRALSPASANAGEAAPAAPSRRAVADPVVAPPASTREDDTSATAGPAGTMAVPSIAPLLVGPPAVGAQLPAAAPAVLPVAAAVPSADSSQPPSAPPAPAPARVKTTEPSAPLAAPVQVIQAAPAGPALPVATGSGDADRPSAPVVRIEMNGPPGVAAPPRPDVMPAASMAPATRGAQMAPMMEGPRSLPHREHAASVAPRQPTERHRDKPMSGTISIDGVELGRWIADHLAHAASRPPPGGAGFDPRMTPVWAGAPIGA